MVPKSLFSFAALVAFSGLPAFGQVLTGPIVNPTTGSSYYLLETAGWTTSQATAVSLGGNLVTINNQAEQDWVFDTFGAWGGVNRNLWIGLNDQTVEGQFEWVSGDSVAFTNWNAGEPSNSFGGIPETYVHIWAPNETEYGRVPGRWNDIVDSPSGLGLRAEFYGVVEVVPGPSSIAFLAIGAMFAVPRRR